MGVDVRMIQQRRHLCLVIVRGVALLLVLVGALVAGMAFQSRIGRYSGFEYLAVPVLAILAAFWAPALVLAAASRPLSRWLVPVPSPESECPQCGYSLRNLKAPICPECGQTLRTIEPTPTRTPGQK
jgi:uncharacterized paraquat-inducible protein A